jgi:hypothetical protein
VAPRQPDETPGHVRGMAPAIKFDPGRRRPSRRAALKGLAALGAAELAVGSTFDRALAQPTAVEDPVVARIGRYLTLHQEAMRRSREWRATIDALRRRGFDASPSYECCGMMFALCDGDTSPIAAYFDAGIAAAPNHSSRSAMSLERDWHLRAADQAYRRWRAAVGELRVAEASELNDTAWDAVDALNLNALWAVRPRTMQAAIALLRLVRCTGWDCGCDPDDYAGPAQGLDHVVAFLEEYGARVRDASE